MKKTVLLFGIILGLIFIPGCKKKPEVFQGVVTFISGTLKINNNIAAVGNKIEINDTLSTDVNSLAVVQIAQTAVLTLSPDTELKFDNLLLKKDKSEMISMFLTRGCTFHKIIRKGIDYKVKTPTAVASVRGTSFEVRADENKYRISVLNGIVQVANTSGGTVETNAASNQSQNNEVKTIELIAGQAIESISGIIGLPAVLDKVEMDNLTQLDSIALVPDVEKIVPQSNPAGNTENKTWETPAVEVITETVKDLLLNRKPDDPESPKNQTVKEKPVDSKTIYVEKLNEIKDQNNGKLDKIILRNGEVVMGMITERGAVYKVLTPDGTIEILPANIESQTITH